MTPHGLAVARVLATVVVGGLIALPEMAAARPCADRRCGKVRVHADVEHARVSIGRGPAIGYAPLTLDLPAGTYVIVVTRTPARPWTQRLTVAAGSTTTTFASLSKLPEADVRADRVACDDGERAACGRLGATLARSTYRVMVGDGAALLEQTCDHGVVASCHDLGRVLDDGLGGAEDGAGAAVLYKKACDAGRAAACTDLGVLNEAGKGVPADRFHALELYTRGCGGGDLIGCHREASLRGGAVPPLDDATSLALHQRGCDRGDGPACTNLGAMVETGKGTAIDLPRTVAVYRRACRLQHARGCTRLGDALIQGRGTAPDPRGAVDAYTRGCTGDPHACTQLGVIYQRDSATDNMAFHMLGRGCSGGDPAGCTNLGVMYERGQAIVADRGKASELYGKGCDGGDPAGCELAKKACDDGVTAACRP